MFCKWKWILLTRQENTRELYSFQFVSNDENINFTRYDQYSVKYLSSRFLSKTVYVSGDVSIIHGQ